MPFMLMPTNVRIFGDGDDEDTSTILGKLTLRDDNSVVVELGLWDAGEYPDGARFAQGIRDAISESAGTARSWEVEDLGAAGGERQILYNEDANRWALQVGTPGGPQEYGPNSLAALELALTDLGL